MSVKYYYGEKKTEVHLTLQLVFCLLSSVF